jgi:hypothetical protein
MEGRGWAPSVPGPPGLLLSVKGRKSELKICGEELNSAQDHSFLGFSQ